jgi:hypothetical protein
MGLFTSRWPFIQTNSSRLEVQFNIQLQMQPGLTLGRSPHYLTEAIVSLLLITSSNFKEMV